MHNYRELNVWKKSVDLATLVYKRTKKFPPDERFGLTAQIRRSCISISSNIAEGAGRGSPSQFSHFVHIAYGSCYELATQLIISKNLGYISAGEFDELDRKITEIQKMAYRLKETMTSKT